MVTREVQPRSSPVETTARASHPADRAAFRQLLESQPSTNTASTTPTAIASPTTAATAAPVTTGTPAKSGLAGLATSITPNTTSAINASPATPWTPANSEGPHSIPTAEDLFGAHPWLDNPTGYAPNGQIWSYNPTYFATHQTAETVAAMVGGQVVEQNQFCPNGPLKQTQPNEMVQLADGRLINAGEFVGFFTHGYPQYYVDHLVQQELKGEVG